MIEDDSIVNKIEGSDIDETLFSELVEEYTLLSRAFYRNDFEKTLNKTGKFCETFFQLIEELLDGEYSAQPNFNEIADRCENLEKGSYPESIRILIPRIGKSLYSLRSKRGAVHKSEVNPQFIDAHLSVNKSSWVLAELVRLYGEDETEKLRRVTDELVTRSLPFVEEFEDGDIMLLIDPDSCKEECMLILYHFYPERLTNDELDSYLGNQSRENILTSLSNAEDEMYVHRNNEGNKLTRKGRLYIEEMYGPDLEVEVDF